MFLLQKFLPVERNKSTTLKGLVAEPKGHVTEKAFERMVSLAQQQGFTVMATPHISRSRVVLLKKETCGKRGCSKMLF